MAIGTSPSDEYIIEGHLPIGLTPSPPSPQKEQSWMVFILPASFAIILNILIFVFLMLWGVAFFTQYSPIDYFFGTTWDPRNGVFGFVPMGFGTFAVVLIATIIAVPIGFCVSIFLAEIAHPRIRSTFKVIIELLAGIPSVVYALIGIWYVIPLVHSIFGGASGFNPISGGVVLSIMILPIIITLSDDALRGVPSDQKEAAYALGSTKWQVIHKVSLPLASPGMFSAVVLALSRAFGETIVVLLITGSTPNIPNPIWDFTQPIRTITANIVAELGDAMPGSIEYEGILVSGLVLFAITFLFNYVSSRFQRRMFKKYTAFKAAS